MQKLLGTSLLILLFLPFSITLHAQEGIETGVPEEVAAEIAEALFIEESAVPAIEAIINSLEAQNAPVPTELRELLEYLDDPTEFALRAERYFGEGWEETVLEDAASLTASETILMVRTRIYLSSLITQSDTIALRSPEDAEDIRAVATDLIAKTRAIDRDEEREAFFQEFGEVYAEIFPEAEDEDLSSFRTNVTKLLADINDALDILVQGRAIGTMRGNLAELQSHLQLVADEQQLTAWLSRFETFSTALLRHTIPVDTETLKADVRVLLTNLSSYLRTLNEMRVETGNMVTHVEEMIQEISPIESEEDLQQFLTDVEAILTNIISFYEESSPTKAQ
jgi:hypothetical protein